MRGIQTVHKVIAAFAARLAWHGPERHWQRNWPVAWAFSRMFGGRCWTIWAAVVMITIFIQPFIYSLTLDGTRTLVIALTNKWRSHLRSMTQISHIFIDNDWQLIRFHPKWLAHRTLYWKNMFQALFCQWTFDPVTDQQRNKFLTIIFNTTRIQILTQQTLKFRRKENKSFWVIPFHRVEFIKKTFSWQSILLEYSLFHFW